MVWIRAGSRLLVALGLSCFAYIGPARAQQLPAPNIAYGNRTVLIGAEGEVKGTAKVIDMGPGKMGWIQSWANKNDSVSWHADVARTGDYTISVILESSGRSCSVDVTMDQHGLHAACGPKGWNRVQVGTLHLVAGKHSIQLTSSGSTPLSKFFSLEFIRPPVKEHLAALGRKQQVSTDWMVEAKYGLMFHWTSQSMPREGPPLSYCDAVRNFDVDKFANLVSEMGAGFVVFTTSHAGFYFPGPNPVIDSILPGRTCPRDLIGDLADALNRRQIRLELYFHPGHDDPPWWRRTHFDQDKVAYFKQWRAIISSIGNRYGKKLAGWWFDDASFTYYPFNPDWEQMAVAARAGNPNRVLAYNDWIMPKVSNFDDVYPGENAMWDTKYEDLQFLPAGGTGRFTGGPQAGLQAEITALINGDWGHFKRDQPIGPPRFSANEIVPKLKDAFSRRAVPLLDIEVYQDGTTSPETFQLFQTLKRDLDSSRNSAPGNDPGQNSSSTVVIDRLVRDAGGRKDQRNEIEIPPMENSPVRALQSR